LLRKVSLTLEAETAVQEIARLHNSKIRVLDCKDLNKKDMAFLIDVSTPGGKADDVIDDFKAKKVFKRVYAGESEEQPSRGLCIAILDRPAICQAVLDCGAFCLNCPYSANEGDGKWNLLVKDSEQLKALLAKLEDLDVEASIGGLSGLKQEDELTSRQIEVLANAISLGYFEFPRRLSLTELSHKLGIKPSTLSQILRAAEGKVMARYAGDTNVANVAPPKSVAFWK
jgi:predicted DNA binding protein